MKKKYSAFWTNLNVICILRRMIGDWTTVDSNDNDWKLIYEWLTVSMYNYANSKVIKSDPSSYQINQWFKKIYIYSGNWLNHSTYMYNKYK